MIKGRVSKGTGYWLASVSVAAMFSSSTSEVQAQAVQTTDELIVYGTVVTRNRSDTVAPVLSYDLEYFQRFEPISAGDALKRVPGVSFSSDVLEYDRLQLRGFPAIYAQVQINGQLQRGGGNDSVFAVDRIPAEFIDSVEIIRSPSADVSSEQIAGAANIELKKAGTIKGGWVRGSGLVSRAMNYVARARSATAPRSGIRPISSRSTSSSGAIRKSSRPMSLMPTGFLRK